MKSIRRLNRIMVLAALLTLVAFLYIGLQGSAIATPLSSATADLTGLGTHSALHGQVSFAETASGVQITAHITGAPSGQHGFHIHANGSCADNGNAAGGHFNPNNTPHGKVLIDGLDRAHAGDLGNILIDAEGAGDLVQTVPGLTLDRGQYAIANHAVILHELRDDFGQPTGNAGGRIGCGVIAVNQ